MNNIYSQNRANLTKQLKDANYIVIGGNGLISRSGDTNYSFRQDSNLLYLTGLNEPFLSLFIDVKLSKTYLVLPKQNKLQTIFEGAINIDELLKISKCNDVIDYLSLAKTLKNQTVYYNLPAKNNLNGLYTNPHRRWLKNYLQNHNVTFKDIRPAMANLRMIKQPYEVDNIAKAVKITKNTINKISPNIWQDSLTEQQIAWQITAEFAKHNVTHAYQPIVASNPNSAILHHLPTNKDCGSSNSVLLDVGAEYNFYSADISRTICKHQDQIYNDLTLAQQQIIEFIKPGLYFKDLQFYAKSLINDIAKQHKIKQSLDELFPHAIGHHLGLDVHDVADYSKPLESGMVITIEPGIYSHELKLGYRIEDDIVIKDNGSLVL